MALTDKLTAIGDAVREITGGTALIPLDDMPDEIRSAGSGGGDVKVGVITPAANTQTLTIEHGYGSTDYNFFMIAAMDSVASYSKAVYSASALNVSNQNSIASLSFEYRGTVEGIQTTRASGNFGHMSKDNTNIDANRLELTTTTGKYPLNSSYPDVVFKAGVRYFWLVAKV